MPFSATYCPLRVLDTSKAFPQLNQIGVFLLLQQHPTDFVGELSQLGLFYIGSEISADFGGTGTVC